ncbi:MAG: chromate transporter [Sarcina sp.]
MKLLYIIFKTGLLGFGGGNSITESLFTEVVKNDILTLDDFMKLRSISYCIPGAVSLNLTFMIGYKLKGFIYGLICMLLLVLPGILITSIVVYLDIKLYSEITRFIKIAVIAMLLTNLVKICTYEIRRWFL